MGRILKRASAESSRTPGEIPAGAAGGEALLAAARAEAAAILEAARLEAEGAMESRAAERERLRAELAVESGEARARSEEEQEEEIVSLALAVAERVLAVAVEDPRAARETARRALRLAGGQGSAVLRCHPADEPGLRDALRELVPAGPVSVVPELRPDPAVGRGGAVVDTGAGVVDARIEQQLRVVARCLGGGE